MLRRFNIGCIAVCAALVFVSNLPAKVLDKVAHGNAPVKSIDAIAFAPDGVLLIGDGRGAQVFAIQTGDMRTKKMLSAKIDAIGAKLAERLGAKPEGIEIIDLAVNPSSGTAYIAVRKQDDKSSLIFTVDGDGKIGEFALESVDYARIALPSEGQSPVNKITDLAWADDRLLVAGAAAEEFASKIYIVPGPLANEAQGVVHSAETYHVSHHKWETKAPMSAEIIPYKEDGKLYVVGAFACTPIVKYPVEALAPGAKVKGISVIELGSGNRPMDMFSYQKDGREYVLTNTFRRKPQGPSPYWTVRFERDLLGENEKINENATQRLGKDAPTERFQTVDAYSGVTQMDQLDDSRALVLRIDGNGKLDLEPIALP